MKDTIWQRLTTQSGPFAGAGLFACLLSAVTLWFSGGAIGAWVSACTFAILVGALAFVPRRILIPIAPMILGIGALGLAGSTGGLNGGAISACLWPILASNFASAGRTNRQQLLLGFSASIAALLGVVAFSFFFVLPTFNPVYGQAGILALGVCAALACANILSWGRLFGDQSRAQPFQIDALQMKNERDAAVNDAQIARMQTKDRAQFMAEMSHEIRTPLNAILGFADTMRESVLGPMPPAYNDYPELIHKSGSHLLDLVSDLLDLSKVEAGRYEVVVKSLALDELVSEGVRISSGAARARGVQIRHEASGPVLVDADPRALRQIIFNLLSNAIKFTPKDGRIIVRIKADVSARTANLEVEDNGEGMSEADLARVGEPWTQASNPQDRELQNNDTKRVRGSGLGLALVKRFAQMQGGELELISSLGTGTLARVILPLSQTIVTPPA